MKHEARVYEMASHKGPNLLTINTKTEKPRKYSVFVLFCFIACAQFLVSVMKVVFSQLQLFN